MARICLAAVVLASSLVAFVLCICIIGVSPKSSGAAATCTGTSSAVGTDQSTGGCSTESIPPGPNTAPGTHGLPPDYTIPPSASAAAAIATAFALHQLDKPYVFGAAGPYAYDCSGLTMAAWARAGVALPHSTLDQARAGTQTTRADLVPGDLVLVPGDDGSLGAPGHVGMYLGSGLVLNAADERIGIRVQPYDDFVRVGRGLSALRHIG